MAVALSPNAKQQFFTDGSTVAAGYKLHTYAAGTTTPLATYSDRAGTVENLNPVTLDARGEAVIYLTPGLVYDYVLKTDTGATVWTRPGVFNGSDVVNASQFGVTGVGDETDKITKAINHAFSTGKTLIVDTPVYVTKLAITSGSGAIRCEGEGEFRPHASADQSDIYDSELIEFGEGVTNSRFDIRIDMLGMSKSGLRIRGDDNVVDHFFCRNITATPGRTKNLWGCGTSGNRTVIKYAQTIDCTSAPTMGAGCATVIVDAFAEDTTVGVINAMGGSSAYLGNGKNTRIDFAYVDGCIDNGIYVIEDSENFYCDTLHTVNCPDEALVFSGDTNSYVGHLIAVNCGRGLGISNSENPRVGVIDWYVNNPASGTGSPLFLRPINVATDSLEIGELNVRGVWGTGAPIWTLDTGTLTNLSIGRVRGRLRYDDPTETATQTLGFVGASINYISIGEIDIVVTDVLGTLTAADVFRLNLPTGLTRASAIGRVLLSANGGAHLVRLVNIAQTVLNIGGCPTVRADLSPPVIQNFEVSPTIKEFVSGSAPTQGTWSRGDRCYHTNPSASGFEGWVCVLGGTPGTWKTFGTIAA